MPIGGRPGLSTRTISYGFGRRILFRHRQRQRGDRRHALGGPRRGRGGGAAAGGGGARRRLLLGPQGELGERQGGVDARRRRSARPTPAADPAPAPPQTLLPPAVWERVIEFLDCRGGPSGAANLLYAFLGAAARRGPGDARCLLRGWLDVRRLRAGGNEALSVVLRGDGEVEMWVAAPRRAACFDQHARTGAASRLSQNHSLTSVPRLSSPRAQRV